MASEWPDYEKQAKERKKAKRQMKREDSFIDDSDVEDPQTKVTRRKQECE